MHSYFIAANYASKGIMKLDVSTDPQIIDHLQRLVKIFCLNIILHKASPLAVSNHLKASHLQNVETVLNQEIQALRP
jgi:hypothetical protein